MLDAILQFIQEHRSEILCGAIGFLAMAIPILWSMWKERKLWEVPEAGEVGIPYRTYMAFRRDVLDPYMDIEEIVERCGGAVPPKPIHYEQANQVRCLTCRRPVISEERGVGLWTRERPKNSA